MTELLDDLRDRVWTHYGLVIQGLLSKQRVTQKSSNDFDTDLLF